jgi:hypothetical protein
MPDNPENVIEFAIRLAFVGRHRAPTEQMRQMPSVRLLVGTRAATNAIQPAKWDDRRC